MNSRVFVVHEQPQFNVSPATEFGELIFMMGAGEHALNPKRVVDEMRIIIQSRNFTKDDYLLLIGDPVLIACASACVDQWLQSIWKDITWDSGPTPPTLKVLKWDRELKRYLPIELPLAH